MTISAPDKITLSFYNEDGGPGWMEGEIDLTDYSADEYYLILDGPNYVEAYYRNIDRIMIISDKSFIHLVRQSGNRFYVAESENQPFSGQIYYRMLLPADSGAEMALTFCRVPANCKPCNQ